MQAIIRTKHGPPEVLQLKEVAEPTPFEQTAETYSYVETGHKKGNVVITLEQNSKT